MLTPEELHLMQVYVDHDGNLTNARTRLNLDEGAWVNRTRTICQKLNVAWTVEAAFALLRQGKVTL